MMTATAIAVAADERPARLGFYFTYHNGAADKRSGGWLRVQGTNPGDPADRAGIKAGDMIIAIDGKPLEFHSAHEAFIAFAKFRPGQVVHFTVLRAGKRFPVNVQGEPMTEEQYAGWKTMYAMAQRNITRPPAPK